MIFFPNVMQAYLKAHANLVIAGLLSVCGYLYLCLHSQHYAELSLIEMWSVCLICALLSFYAWWCYQPKKSSRQSNYHAFNAPIDTPIKAILCFAIVFRVIGVFTFPVLEDDMYRFLWDGRMTVETGSPYSWVPADFFDDATLAEPFETILGLINHPEIATVYGPTSQALFALSYLIAPGEIWPLQAMLALADMIVIFVLLRLANARHLILYAWSPLIIKEFAITAHPDILGVCLLLVAFFAYTKHAWFYTAMFLALAAGVKVFAFILVPLLLRLHWQSWIVFLLTLVLIALPFNGDISSVWIPDGLSAMANNWLFNAPIYLLFQNIVSFSLLKVVLLGTFSLCAGAYCLYVYLQRQHLPLRADYLFGLFFICIPVFNPWYLAWVLPFAVIYPSVWAWTASVTLLLSYASGINLGFSPHYSELQLYQQPLAVVAVQFSLIGIAAAVDMWRHHINSKNSEKLTSHQI
ncbi:MAG: hypothetical protein ACRBEE_15800 [Arenicella sp.]